MQPLLLSEPWDLYTDRAKKLDPSNTTSKYTVSGSGSPRIIAPFDIVTRYGPKHELLPKISFPFLWGGNRCVTYPLPLNPHPQKPLHDYAINLFINNSVYEVVQANVIGRPDAGHESCLGRKVDSFIEWQIYCFSELVNDESTIVEIEEKSKNIVRRNWKSVRRVWIDVGIKDAIMSLIVKLAQDDDLRRIFNSIARRPRRILLRYRKNTQLHRIQELDSACIRDIARRPGRTFKEKAGPRQELLAVHRRNSPDTFENQVFGWVLNRMIGRAMDYVVTNQRHLQNSSPRVQCVSRYGRQCQEWFSLEHFQVLSHDKLQHPIQPNYSLQMDERYHHVYKTYRKLLKEQHARDDAWEWQRTLWSESARQLVSCTLTELFNGDLSSTPYYKFEGDQGVWTVSPNGPGPFNTNEILVCVFYMACSTPL